MTQKELGKKLDRITQQQIGQWENGNKNPKLETIQKLASALDVPLSDIMGKEEFNKIVETKQRIKRQIEDGTIKLLPSSLLDDYSRLNNIGKHEAEKRVHELTEIPRYTQNEKYISDKEE